jgi:hypothetical protein
MPKLSRKASKKAKRGRMQSEMHKFKHGELHSGSKHGPMVKSREQAIAIGLSESGQSRKVGKKKGKGKGQGKKKGKGKGRKVGRKR